MDTRLQNVTEHAKERWLGGSKTSMNLMCVCLFQHTHKHSSLLQQALHTQILAANHQIQRARNYIVTSP